MLVMLFINLLSFANAISSSDAFMFGSPVMQMYKLRARWILDSNGACINNLVPELKPAVPSINLPLLDPDTLSAVAFVSVGNIRVLNIPPSTNERYFLVTVFDMHSNLITSIDSTNITKGAKLTFVGPNVKNNGSPDFFNSATSEILISIKIYCHEYSDYENAKFFVSKFSITKPSNTWIRQKLSMAGVYQLATIRVNLMKVGLQESDLDLKITDCQNSNIEAAKCWKLMMLGLEEWPMINSDSHSTAIHSLVSSEISRLETITTTQVQDAITKMQQTLSKYTLQINPGWYAQQTTFNKLDYESISANTLSPLFLSPPSNKLSTFISRFNSSNYEFHGSLGYILEIQEKDLPKDCAFWSVTVYFGESSTRANRLIKNELNSYSINSRNYMKDGSDFKIAFMSVRPTLVDFDRFPLFNWLPVDPYETFEVVFRVWSPLGGLEWTPNAIVVRALQD